MKTKVKIDIDHLAQLANITLSKQEKKQYQEQLEEILEFVGQLEEIDTDQVPSTARTTKSKNVTFKDAIKKRFSLKSLKGLKIKKLTNKNYFQVEKVKWE